ncbi:MAG: MarR family transcriptional regulator [Actinocatenispora sp.]
MSAVDDASAAPRDHTRAGHDADSARGGHHGTPADPGRARDHRRREPAGTPDEAPTDELQDALGIVEWESAVLVRHLEMLRRRTDVHDHLDRAEYLLLRTLHRRGPLAITTLAAALGLDPSTAGRQVAAMQDAGLIERSALPEDRRCRIIAPTEAGVRQMEEVRQRRADNVGDLLADWSDTDVRALGSMFAKYNRAVADRYLTGDPATRG